MLRGRQTQFYIDIIYGIVFGAGFGYLLFVEMDPRVAAFQGGLVLGYFLRVWENMTVYERILHEEVAAEAEEAVAGEVAAQLPSAAQTEVAREIEDQVPDEVTAEIERQIPAEVTAEVEEQVGDEIDAQLDDRVAKEVEAQMDDHNRRNENEDTTAQSSS